MLISHIVFDGFQFLLPPSVAALEPLKSSLAGGSCPERFEGMASVHLATG